MPTPEHLKGTMVGLKHKKAVKKLFAEVENSKILAKYAKKVDTNSANKEQMHVQKGESNRKQGEGEVELSFLYVDVRQGQGDEQIRKKLIMTSSKSSAVCLHKRRKN